jgi:hypothetical protein
MVLDPILELRHGRLVHGVGRTGRRCQGLTAPAAPARVPGSGDGADARTGVGAGRADPVGRPGRTVRAFPRADHAGSALRTSPAAARWPPPSRPRSHALVTPALLVVCRRHGAPRRTASAQARRPHGRGAPRPRRATPPAAPSARRR